MIKITLTCMAIVLLVFLPDAESFILASSGNLVLWDIESGNKIHIYTQLGNHHVVALLPQGKSFLATSGSMLDLRDVESGQKLHTYDGRGETKAIAILPDGKRFISSRGGKLEWGLPDSSKEHQFQRNIYPLVNLHLNPNVLRFPMLPKLCFQQYIPVLYSGCST